MGVTLQPQVGAHERAGHTILLVEDDPFVRDATGRILKSAGYAVLAAPDALSALKLFQENQAALDLVMTDFVLPGRSGYQLGQDLRQHSPRLAVLLTSGYANPDHETEDPEKSTYFLSKPYSRRILVDKIEAILASQSHLTNKE